MCRVQLSMPFLADLYHLPLRSKCHLPNPHCNTLGYRLCGLCSCVQSYRPVQSYSYYRSVNPTRTLPVNIQYCTSRHHQFATVKLTVPSRPGLNGHHEPATLIFSLSYFGQVQDAHQSAVEVLVEPIPPKSIIFRTSLLFYALDQSLLPRLPKWDDKAFGDTLYE